MNNSQFQYFSRGTYGRWTNCSEEDSILAKAEGFAVRELVERQAPKWIVNDLGELGVLINDQAYFMYKGDAFQYSGTATDGGNAYRPVDKREFGESGPISPMAYGDRHRYRRWRPLPKPLTPANNLTPPDVIRCQAEIPNGNNAFTLGGKVGRVRCMSTPRWIAIEKQPGEDGAIGSMSLCDSCKAALIKQMGDICTFTPINNRIG